MRFLFLGPGFPGVAHSESGSGIGTYLQCLAHELKTRGHECHLIIWSNDGQEYTLHQDGLTIYLIPHAYWRGVERLFPDSRDMATVFRKVLALESQRAFDAIEVESDEGVSKWVLQYFKAKSFLRVFTTLEQMARIKEVPENRILRHRLAREQKSFRCTSMVLVPSQMHREEILRMGVSGELVRVNYLGIKGVNSSFSQSGGELNILMVGSFDRRKGYDRLRPVMETLAKKKQKATFTIISAADAARMGLEQPYPAGIIVKWLHSLSKDELCRQYRETGVFLHLARYESFGLPLIEAASAAVPVVSTSVGIAPELLANDLARFLVDGDNPTAVADRLIEAVEARASIGRELRLRFEKQFSVVAMTDGWLDSVSRFLGKM